MRTEDPEFMFAEVVHDAGGQRPFRSYNGQIDTLLLHKGSQTRDIGGCQRDAFRQCRDPGIAGSTIELCHRRTLDKLPRYGVFAPAASYNDNFHKTREAGCIRSRTDVESLLSPT